MFNPKIVVLRSDSKVVGIHSVVHDYTKKDYLLIIKNTKGRIIFQGKPNNKSMINIDIAEELCTVEYCYPNEVKPFFIDKIDMSKHVLQTDVKKKIQEDEFMRLVYNRLDNPTGSDAEIVEHTNMIKKSAFDKDARNYVENKIIEALLSDEKFNEIDTHKVANEIYAKYYGMGILQELDDDIDVSEIMVNATMYPKFHCDIFYIKTNQGKKRYEKTFHNLEEMLNIFSRTIAFSKKDLNSVENAIIEATRANGDRINIIIPQASENYVLNIRKFANFIPTADNMLANGTVTEEMDRFLQIITMGKANVGIGGEMGTGKTTFINYLLGYTEPIDRKVIISSVKEIGTNYELAGHDIVFLKVDDDLNFSFKKLIRTSLRTSADRIIIPESRGGEFKQVYEANLKTKGNMFTAHALTDNSFLDVCADMYMEDSPSDAKFVKDKIAKSIDIVIIMKKVHNKIKIKSISEVELDENSQLKGMNQLFYWDYGFESGAPGYKRTGNRITPALRERLLEENVPREMVDSI